MTKKEHYKHTQNEIKGVTMEYLNSKSKFESI